MKKLLILILFNLSLFSNEILNFTQEELNYIKNKKEIIVSNEIDYEPIDFNVDGKPMGYSIDLLEAILKNSGLKINYVSNTWTNLYNDFENKKIDLVHTLYKSKEREEKFIFSKGYLQGVHAFVTNKNLEKISTIEELFGKRVGVTKGWFQETYIKQFPQIERVYYDNLEDKLKALSYGEIDAIINNKYVANYFIKKYGFIELKVSDFVGNELNKKTNTFHFAANKEDKILINIINKAFNNLSQEELEEISSKWFGKDEKDLGFLKLTKEEKEYLKSIKSIKFPTYSDWRPFNFVENGVEKGYIIELTKIIAGKLNINLEFINGYVWDEHKQMLLENRVDLIGNMAKTPEREKLYLFANNPTLVVSSALVSKDNYKNFNELTGKKLGTLKGSAQEAYVKKKYPYINFVSYGNVLELIQAISNAEVDAIMDNYSVINYQLSRLNLLNDLKINIVLDDNGLTLPLHYAVNQANPILLSIINKTYSLIPIDEINNLKKKWGLYVPSNTKLNEETFVTIFGERFSQTSVLIFTFVLLILSLIAKLLNTNKNIENKSEEIRKDFKQNKSLLYTKYAVGLLIIFATLIASFITLNKVNEEQRGLGNTINLSGKQRMLSQRTTLLAMQYLKNQDEIINYNYNNLINLMEEEHQKILTSISDEKILDFYTNKPNLNLQVSNFVRLHKEFISIPTDEKLNEIIATQEVLLSNLNTAVNMHENYLKKLEDKLTNIIWSSLILLIIVLLIEAFYIFLPLISKLANIASNFQEEKEKVTIISNEQKSLLSLFDKSDAVLFKWNNDERWSIQYVSYNVIKLFGYDKEDFLSHKIQFADLILEDDIQRVTNEVKDFSSNGLEFMKHEPYKIRTKTGEIKWVLDYTTATKNEKGETTHFIGYLVDISKLIETTKELEANKETLKKALAKALKSEDEARVAEEEALATQEQLEILNEELKHAYEAKSEFLSNMSHEIRTPLSGIIGITDIILEKGNLSSEDKKNLEIVKSSSNRLKGIINDILDFSKIQAGKFQIMQKEFSLRYLIDDIQNLFAPQIINKKLKFNINIADDVEDILVGDELRISQIITNLLGNSIKFTNSGIIELDIKTISKNKDYTELEFTIKDTGIGMSPKVQKTIFDSFTQGELSNTKNFQGTGLGLSISKRLVELMGGDISFKSIENIGTSFYFKLELKYSKDAIISKKEKSEIKDIKFSNSKILVAEDSNINRMVIEKFLQDISVEVDFAYNGIEAVDMTKKNKYELIFMDIQMPEMDGYEATTKIRYFDKQIPIIALSAAVLQEDIQKSLDVGMNEHLAKPIDKQELYDLLGRYLKDKICIENEIKINDNLSKYPEFKKVFSDFSNSDALDLLEMFYGQYKDLDKKILNQNKDELKKIIHKLKGASSNLGFKNIIALCKNIESENFENCEDKLELLIKKVNDLLIKIKELNS